MAFWFWLVQRLASSGFADSVRTVMRLLRPEKQVRAFSWRLNSTAPDRASYCWTRSPQIGNALLKSKRSEFTRFGEDFVVFA